MLVHHLTIFLLFGLLTNEIISLEPIDALEELTVNETPDLPMYDDIASLTSRRQSESAESYFDWIRKTQRPVEYFRGKRFWLFANKDDNSINAEPVSINNGKHSSLAQGLWRSGIVGRRRRR